MGSLKSAGALIAALVPVAYCGGLIYYFHSTGGSPMQGETAKGLGPTMLGLGVVGLLFMVPVIVRLMRLGMPAVSGARVVASEPEEEAFDADAALARYLARKAEGGSDIPPPVAESGDALSTQARPVFGRKNA
jgi:hypothetical protein